MPPREVEPLFMTPVTGPTRAGRLAKLGAQFRQPFMPWQHEAARLLTEYDPDTGLAVNQLVVITVQRQAGKTALMRPYMLDGLLFCGPSRRLWLTMQTGKYASDWWRETKDAWVAPTSPLAGYLDARSSQGSETLTSPNGSTLSPFPPKENALHSKQGDRIVADEAWFHSLAAGKAIEQAVRPTMATRPGAQFVIVSAAGTDDSGWLRDYVEKGRAGKVAYLEYGIGDADPEDLDLVISRHPAVGHTITPEFIRNEHAKMEPGDFARAYGNAWTKTLERAIPIGTWTAAAADVTVDRSRKFVIGLDVAADGSRAAIAAAEDDRAELIDSLPVVALVDRVLELRRKYGTAMVVGDAAGPAGPAMDALALAGVEIHRLTGQEAATATGMTLDDLATGALHYRPHPALDDAAESAAVRGSGDGGRKWARREASGPICELVAVSWAHWGARRRPRVSARPMLITT